VVGFAKQERKRRDGRTWWVLVAGEGPEDGETWETSWWCRVPAAAHTGEAMPEGLGVAGWAG